MAEVTGVEVVKETGSHLPSMHLHLCTRKSTCGTEGPRQTDRAMGLALNLQEGNSVQGGEQALDMAMWAWVHRPGG